MTRGEGKLGLVLEDTFRYAIQKGVADNNMELIAAAAQLRVLMVAFYADVFILVNKSSGIADIPGLAGKKVSIAEVDSGTYITAKTLLEAYGIPLTGCNNESTRTALPKVISGEYDALIKVRATSGPLNRPTTSRSSGRNSRTRPCTTTMASSGKMNFLSWPGTSRITSE